MDLEKLRNILKGTLDPSVGKEAEAELTKIRKIAGFGPALMQLVMSNELDVNEKQAAVIYLKNLITFSWEPLVKPDASKPQKDVNPDDEFSLHEQDKEFIRNNIVDAVVHCPEIIRVQLGVCTLHIIKQDFPTKWPNIVEKSSQYLNTTDTNLWHGALLCVYQITKNYEYKVVNERKPLMAAMKILLPMLLERVRLLMEHQTDDNMLLQRRILKIFYALCQFAFPHEVLPRPVLLEWMKVFHAILSRPAVPPGTPLPDLEERTEMPGWKLYKWALHILNRIFERYGNPSTCVSDYQQMANWYVKTFSKDVINVLLGIMAQYGEGQYVSPRVMHQTLIYLECGLRQSIVWNHIRPHIDDILKRVVYPELCYNDEDEQLWESDPVEYIRRKNDVYEDLVSPESAAHSLLQTLVRKRKKMLENVMRNIVLLQLDTPNLDPRLKDGAFNMMGCLGNVLTKKPQSREKMEMILLQYVFPEFNSEHGFLRARAFWLLHHFTELTWTSSGPCAIQPSLSSAKAPRNLCMAVEACLRALLHDSALPVQVEAAHCISYFIATQDELMEDLLTPKMQEIVLKLVQLIKETQSEDLTNVITKFVGSYCHLLLPIAVDITTGLCHIFQEVVSCEDGADERALTAMSLLGTVETILTAMEESSPETVRQLEPIVIQLVANILEKNIMEFYEEALSLVYNLTSSHISEDMWRCYELLHHVFRGEGLEYFMEMLPVLHNYVTVDTPAFLSVENRLLSLCQMCEKILTEGEDEDSQCHGAKLLEVIVLQCNPNPAALTDISSLVLKRLFDQSRPIKTAELRTMLLQVIIAGLYANTEVIFGILNTSTVPNTTTPLLTYFINQWLDDIDCFLGLHDRKLAVLGLCTLLQLGPEKVPALEPLSSKILPSLIVLFQGLKRAYLAKAQEENQSESSSEEDSDSDFGDGDALDDNEDELNENDLLGDVSNRVDSQNWAGEPFEVNASIEDDSQSEDSDDDSFIDDLDETNLENFSTPLDKEDSQVDEYWVFKSVMCGLEGSPWFAHLTASLTESQKKDMREIATLADQRKAVMDSKKIEQSGGYNFQQVSVPLNFNFGGSFGGGNMS